MTKRTTVKLKVFGGLTFVKGKQWRTIIAAPSRKRAAELLGETVACLRDYWSETGNVLEMETALARPGVVFRAVDQQGKQFEPIIPDESE